MWSETGCAWEGTYYCFGTTVGSMVTFYNKAMFDEKGIAYPDASTPMTYQEMADLAAQLDHRGRLRGRDRVRRRHEPPRCLSGPCELSRRRPAAPSRSPSRSSPDTAQIARRYGDRRRRARRPARWRPSAAARRRRSCDGRVAMLISDNFTIDPSSRTEMDYGIAPTPIVPGTDPWIV